MPTSREQIIKILVKHAMYVQLTTEEARLLDEFCQKSAVRYATAILIRDEKWRQEQLKIHTLRRTPPTEEMWADIEAYIESQQPLANAMPALIYHEPPSRWLRIWIKVKKLLGW